MMRLLTIALLSASLPIRAYAAAPPDAVVSHGDYKSWVMATLPGPPEGMAVDAQGRIYAIVITTGQVMRLDEKGGYELYATVPSAKLATAGYSIGATFDAKGDLYVAYFWLGSKFHWHNDPQQLACRDSTDQYTGVYKVDARTREVTPVVTKADGWPTCIPDDIAVDSQGNLYVADLTLSGIWKIRPDRTFTLWSAHPLLQWPPQPYTPDRAGANDLVIDQAGKNLYVATDGYPAIVRLPIQADGTAGEPELVAQHLAPLDGIELDDAGNVYVTEPERNRIIAFSLDGKRMAEIATGDTAPLSRPTSLVFRKGMLCTSNLGDILAGSKSQTVTCISGFRGPH